jgi:hypothetical protein
MLRYPQVVDGSLTTSPRASLRALMGRTPECCARKDAQEQLLGRTPECCARKDAQEQPRARIRGDASPTRISPRQENLAG